MQHQEIEDAGELKADRIRVELLHLVVEEEVVVVRRHGLAVSRPQTPADCQGRGGQAVKADTVDGCLTFLLTFRLYRM